MTSPSIGVLGLGVVGHSVVNQLAAFGRHVVIASHRPAVADKLARRHSRVRVGAQHEVEGQQVVVIATATDHRETARRVSDRGGIVVSPSDHVEHIQALLGLRAVVGAAFAPGVTGVLARHLAAMLDSVDEIHVAIHGTGGPDCARQHHRALSGTSLTWFDGEWRERPAGSGRELCWFPGRVGPRDCYRAELADPLVLREAFPEATRISARLSATRRDRMTSRLPMLAPPHRDGGLGAIRVEVRGDLRGGRETLIAGVAARNGHAAGVTAAAVADSIVGGGLAVDGSLVLGGVGSANAIILQSLRASGLQFEEFMGEDYATAALDAAP